MILLVGTIEKTLSEGKMEESQWHNNCEEVMVRETLMVLMVLEETDLGPIL